MNSKFRLLFTVLLLLAVATLGIAADKSIQTPAQTPYVITNDDGLLHTYASYYATGGSQNAPTLTFTSDTNLQGQGIGGGFFGLPRLAMLPSSSAQCLYASNAGTGDIAAVTLSSQTLVGNFLGSDTDAGDANGIGMVLNANYLYAGYPESATIGTFAVLTGCQLSFLGDVAAAGLNGGTVAGMALNGNILVVSYGDGSIESFNVSNGIPVSNGDAQNSTGYLNANTNFPEGVDITSDGHYAVFGDSSLVTTIEVSDISSGKLTTTRQYTVAGGVGPSSTGPILAVGPGINSGAIRLSPDQSMVFVGNSDGGSVAAAYFNTATGRVSGGCTSRQLAGFYNPWAFVGSVATRDTTGTGGVLYVAEYGFTGSYLGVLTINSNGSVCTLTESSASQIPDLLSGGLLSITVFPPRGF